MNTLAFLAAFGACKDKNLPEKASPEAIAKIPLAVFSSSARTGQLPARPAAQALPGQGLNSGAVTLERGDQAHSLTKTGPASVFTSPQNFKAPATMNSVSSGTKTPVSADDYKQTLNDAAWLHPKHRTQKPPVRGTAQDPRFQQPEIRELISTYQKRQPELVNKLASSHGTLALSSGGEQRLLPKLIDLVARKGYEKEFSQLDAVQQDRVRKEAWALLGAIRERLHEMGRL